MSWKDIVKNAEGDYQEILDAIANVEKIREKLHDSIEEGAKDLVEESKMPIELARKLVGSIHDGLFAEIDKELIRYKRILKQIVDRESLR